jgi:hypothetical protein
MVEPRPHAGASASGTLTAACKLERRAGMAAISEHFAYGKLESSTDSWLLVGEQVTLLDISIPFETSLERKMVSVTGRMGIPEGSPFTKLIVEKIVSHDAIAMRAYEIFQSGEADFANENWFRAERELLAA